MLLFFSCPWGISMKWVYRVKLGHDWIGLHLMEIERKGYSIVCMLAQLYYFGLEMGLKGLCRMVGKPGITLVCAGLS